MNQSATPANLNTFEISDVFHPQAVDRFIQHCYRGSYTLESKGRAVNIRHAKRFPDGRNKESFAYLGTPISFHLDIYSLAEVYDASFLKTIAREKLVNALLIHGTVSPLDLATFANKVVSSTESRMPKDEEKHLTNILITSAIVHNHQRWDEEDKRYLDSLVQLNDVFMQAYDLAKTENTDLLMQ